MKILVVDDSPFICHFIRDTLAKAGHNDVVCVDSAVDAFQLLGLEDSAVAEKFDLVLMDFVMQGIDGIEACSLIKSKEHLKDVPLIMITGRTEDRFLKAAFNAGAMDFITKPLSQTVLVTRINSALLLKQEMDRRKAREEELLGVTRLLERANTKLQELSSIDGLTGIANRRYFDQILEREWKRALRYSRPLSLIIIDIDVFKAYNDNYGHLAGDECLKQVAQALHNGTKRSGDLTARYGGEEFAVILPETGEEGAYALAEELRLIIYSLSIEHAFSSVCGVVTTSLGVATMVPDCAMTSNMLIEHADKALYYAKQRGRNRVETYSPGLADQASC